MYNFINMEIKDKKKCKKGGKKKSLKILKQKSKIKREKNVRARILIKT